MSLCHRSVSANKHLNLSNGLNREHECDRQTDRQTDDRQSQTNPATKHAIIYSFAAKFLRIVLANFFAFLDKKFFDQKCFHFSTRPNLGDGQYIVFCSPTVPLQRAPQVCKHCSAVAFTWEDAFDVVLDPSWYQCSRVSWSDQASVWCSVLSGSWPETLIVFCFSSVVVRSRHPTRRCRCRWWVLLHTVKMKSVRRESWTCRAAQLFGWKPGTVGLGPIIKNSPTHSDKSPTHSGHFAQRG